MESPCVYKRTGMQVVCVGIRTTVLWSELWEFWFYDCFWSYSVSVCKLHIFTRSGIPRSWSYLAHLEYGDNKDGVQVQAGLPKIFGCQR